MKADKQGQKKKGGDFAEEVIHEQRGDVIAAYPPTADAALMAA